MRNYLKPQPHERTLKRWHDRPTDGSNDKSINPNKFFTMSLYRVYCINDKCTYAPPVADWKIKEGEIYEVLSEFVPYPKWGLYLELNIQPGVGYPVEYFVRLPAESEEQAIEAENEGLIYQR